jgi:MFS family permease
MPASRGERSGGTSDVRKAVTGASIGNAVEWFDFAIYGFLATFIAASFFPSGNETAALLNTFAIFAAAFSCDHSAGSCSDRWATGSRGNGCWPSSSC